MAPIDPAVQLNTHSDPEKAPPAAYPNKQFFDDTAIFAKECFQIVEWLLVIGLVYFASYSMHSTLLLCVYFLLFLMVTLYSVTAVTRLVWWMFPGIGPGKPRSKKTMLGAALTLVIGVGVNAATTEVAQLFANFQARSTAPAGTVPTELPIAEIKIPNPFYTAPPSKPPSHSSDKSESNQRSPPSN